MPSVAISTFTNKIYLLLEDVDNGRRWYESSRWFDLETGKIVKFDECSRRLTSSSFKWLIEG